MTVQADLGLLMKALAFAAFAWAKQVVEGLRGVHPGLEAAFDAEQARITEIA